MARIIFRCLAGLLAIVAFPVAVVLIFALVHHVGYSWEVVLAVIAIQLGAAKLIAECGGYALKGTAQ